MTELHDAEVPSRIGRYSVAGVVERGSLGRVLLGHDSELDRQVLIKLVDPRGGKGSDLDGTRRKLARSARTIAKISDQHVVHVLDAGIHGGQAFLVTEVVEGHTIGQWVAEAQPTWRRIVEMFVQIGRGLTAMHRHGVFMGALRPDDALIEGDRAKILPLPAISNRHDASSYRGKGCGSAYVAPEIGPGLRGNEHADQYSFCVVLWEALHGTVPASPPSRPKRSRVPARIHRALVRGLSPDPSERHDSMTALVTALTVGQRRRWIWPTATLGLTLGGSVFGWQVVSTAPCEGVERPIEADWNPRRRAEVERAFVATEAVFADDALRSVTAELDDFASRWARERMDACRATHISGDQAESVLDARMYCLERRRHEMDALVELFASADLEVVQRSVAAAQSLTSPTECRDVSLLADVARPAPAQRAAVRQLEERLDRARAAERAGRYDQARGIVEAVIAEARTLDYSPLLASALVQLGSTLHWLSKFELVVDTLEEGQLLAESSGHDVLAMQAITKLAQTLGSDLHRPLAAQRWLDRGEATLERLGEPVTLLAEFSNARGLIAFERENFGVASEQFGKALRLWRETDETGRLRVAHVLNNLALVAYQATPPRFEDALVLHQQALAIKRQTLGPAHPDVGRSLVNLGGVYQRLGQIEEASSSLQEALRLFEAALGPESEGVAMTLLTLTNVAGSSGQIEKAIEYATRSAEIHEKIYGPNHPQTAGALSNLATSIEGVRPDEAAAIFGRVLTIYEDHGLSGGASEARILIGLGNIELNRKAYDRAVPWFERSLEIIDDGGRGGGAFVLHAAFGLGISLVLSDEPAEAIGYLRRAQAAAERTQANPWQRAGIEYGLARALWETGASREEARGLARSAVARLEGMGPGAEELLSDIRDWGTRVGAL